MLQRRTLRPHPLMHPPPPPPLPLPARERGMGEGRVAWASGNSFWRNSSPLGERGGRLNIDLGRSGIHDTPVIVIDDNPRGSKLCVNLEFFQLHEPME